MREQISTAEHGGRRLVRHPLSAYDPESLNAHYSVYRSEGGRLVKKEFAFGVETVRHSVWFALHDGERETWRLAELLGILRSDREFLHDYDARLDALLTENRMAVRDANGCLAEPDDRIEVGRELPVYQEIAREIEVEFADRAVSVLRRAGLHAWRNPVGHIAVGA
jgi:hypothetical protein